MVEKAIGLHDVGHKLGEHTLVGWLEDEDVSRADSFEVGHGDLALVGTAFAEQDLARLELASEGGPVWEVGEVVPSHESKRAGVEVVEADDSVDAICFEVS
jgi:hypothetical protein